MAQVSFYKINNSQLSSLAIKEGQIIFVQDTGKLYIDKDSSNRISVGGASYSAGDGISISGTTISSKNSNIINGSASGSLRTVNSTAESSFYTIGTNAFAEGRNTKASGDNSHAEGANTEARGYHSHAEGNETIASGNISHAEGNNSTAVGNSSHAEGWSTIAAGNMSHSEGQGGYDSISLTGAANTTIYSYSTSSIAPQVDFYIMLNWDTFVAARILAVDTTAQTVTLDQTLSSTALDSAYATLITSGIAAGIASHVEGLQTIATQDYSHAEGCGTIADNMAQHVQGKYNKTGGSYAHIVGNGTDTSNRSNAHTIDWDGRAWFAGNIKIGGTSYFDSNAKTLIAGPASSTELGGLKVRYDSTTQTLYIRNDGSDA